MAFESRDEIKTSSFHVPDGRTKIQTYQGIQLRQGAQPSPRFNKPDAIDSSRKLLDKQPSVDDNGLLTVNNKKTRMTAGSLEEISPSNGMADRVGSVSQINEQPIPSIFEDTNNRKKQHPFDGMGS